MRRLSDRVRKLCGRFVGEESGSLLVVAAVVMTAMIGLAALGTDVGRLVVERQRLSIVADAAALSGAQFLPEAPDTAAATAQSILQKNGIDPLTATVAISLDQKDVTVSATRTVSMSFARIFGASQVEVGSGAQAHTNYLSAYYGAAPLGVPRADWQLGEQVTLKLSPQDGTVSPGNYQALALGKSGASSYEQNLMHGFPAWLRVDEWVATETGNMAGPTVRGAQYRIDQDPYATVDNYTRQSARLMVVPVLEDFNVNGKGEVLVIGFATFFLEEAIDEGNERGSITGRFVRLIVEGEGSDSAPNFGVRVTKLVK